MNTFILLWPAIVGMIWAAVFVAPNYTPAAIRARREERQRRISEVSQARRRWSEALDRVIYLPDNAIGIFPEIGELQSVYGRISEAEAIIDKKYSQVEFRNNLQVVEKAANSIHDQIDKLFKTGR